MADTSATTRQHRPRYLPMSPEAWEARTTYLRLALAQLKDPSAPYPDIKLLTVGPHGPFTATWAAPASDGGGLSVHFTVKNPERGPRWCPPEVFLMLDLLLAFGGGASVNDNGRGWAYVRPWSGNYRHTLGRLVANAGLGDVVRQDKRADHHAQHPQHFRVTSGSPRAEHSQGTPRRSRQDAIERALHFWDCNHPRSAIAITRDEFATLLRDSFRLVDAYYAEDPATADKAA